MASFYIKGQEVLVDDEDFDRVTALAWHLTVPRHGRRYVRHGDRIKTENGPKVVAISLHRFILGHKPGMVVDHINGNPLDNRKSNLRFCTHQQNNANAVKRVPGTSRFKGVTWKKPYGSHHEGRWLARIRVNGNLIYLGQFKVEEHAYAAYCKAAVKYFGEFACTQSTFSTP